MGARVGADTTDREIDAIVEDMAAQAREDTELDKHASACTFESHRRAAAQEWEEEEQE